jgi:hypothetical protein
MCNATAMATLILDGLSAASSCRGQSLVSLPALGYNPQTYSLFQGRSGSGYGGGNGNGQSLVALPSCVLSLPQLQSLHVSGNGLVGNLSAYLPPLSRSSLSVSSLSSLSASGSAAIWASEAMAMATAMASPMLSPQLTDLVMSHNFFSGELVTKPAQPPSRLILISPGHPDSSSG